MKSLTLELEFEKKLERSAPPKSKSETDTREPDATETVMAAAARPTVNEKSATTATKLNRRSAVIAVAALFVIGFGMGEGKRSILGAGNRQLNQASKAAAHLARVPGRGHGTLVS